MSQQGNQGTQNPNSDKGDFNSLWFVIQQAISRLNIATVVQVVKVYDPGGVSAAGTVDVQPLVNQLDGFLNTVEHAVIYGLPYMRIQGGANAFVIVPKVGDKGIALFADRDISAVKSTGTQANPGSLRRFDMADGMYFGGMLNAAPQRYVRIDDSGVTIEGVAAVTIHGNNTVVNATDAKINATTAEINASSSLTVTSPTSTFNGAVIVTGLITTKDINVTG